MSFLLCMVSEFRNLELKRQPYDLCIPTITLIHNETKMSLLLCMIFEFRFIDGVSSICFSLLTKHILSIVEDSLKSCNDEHPPCPSLLTTYSFHRRLIEELLWRAVAQLDEGPLFWCDLSSSVEFCLLLNISFSSDAHGYSMAMENKAAAA